MQKKIVCMILMVMMLLSVVSCNRSKNPESSASESDSSTSDSIDNENKINSSESLDENVSGDLYNDSSSSISNITSNSFSSSKQPSVSVSNTSNANPISSSISSSASIDESTFLHYYFGGNADPNKAKLKIMGDRGFYPMYSTKVNVNIETTNYDLYSLKECKLTETGLWKPAESVIDSETNEWTGTWFSVRKDGFIGADTAFSAALKWVCQTDGVYNIKISFSGGTSAGAPTVDETKPDGQFIPAADGVYASAYIKGVKVYGLDTYKQTNHRAEMTETLKENVTLKKGDMIYFISDSKRNGGWDDPWWYLAVDQVG